MVSRSLQSEPKRVKSARKKTARACNHCHKAHMTCDESRPCKRCVSRDLGSSCVDAPRKKKKYLIDVPDGLETPPPQLPPSNSQPTHSSSQETSNYNHDINNKSVEPHLSDLYPPQLSNSSIDLLPPATASYSSNSNSNNDSAQAQFYVYDNNGNNQNNRAENSHTNSHNDQISNHHIQQYRQGGRPGSKFMSTALNNEYSILSDIIKQDDILQHNSMRISPSLSHSDNTLSPPSANLLDPNTRGSSGLRQSSINSSYSDQSTPSHASLPHISHDIYNTYKQGDKKINQYMLGFIQDQFVTYPEVMKIIDGERTFDNNSTDSKKLNLDSKPALSFSITISDSQDQSSSPFFAHMQDNPWGLRYKEAEDIYAKIDKPFSYTPGFHSLIYYLRKRFSRKDLIKMAKSMASYRPSLIACTNTLKVEDFIFMEQCFQRTLLEYDKFISISGTPTIVWRRTGQISYVSEEFCILTGWAKDQLLNKITFIVELMDDSSVIEYFDLFSTIAYGDFKAATMGSCTLKTPDNSTLKTTCIWTLKRDVFGNPMMIIGNFLPIL